MKRIAELAVQRGGKVQYANPLRSHLRAREGGPKYQVITIEDWTPPPLNKIMRGKRATRISVGKATDELLAISVCQQQIAMALGARRVLLEVCYESTARMPDPDSIQKALGDALVNCGALLEDNYQSVEWLPPVYHLGPKKTLIHLWDIPVKVPGKWLTPGGENVRR